MNSRVVPRKNRRLRGRHDIATYLRQQIVQGVFLPGDRLPIRTELERDLNSSTVTVQRAFDTLIGEGFIEARGRKGTFVAAHPPHLTHYGMVFPFRQRPHKPWSQFWTALVKEAAGLCQAKPFRLSMYYGLEDHDDLEQYQQLVADVNADRLAGLIFATPPYYLLNSPILTRAGLPRVAMMARADIPDVLAVNLDLRSFMDQVLAQLAGHGRKRLAIVTVPFVLRDRPAVDYLRSRAAQAGLTIPDWCIQACEPSVAETAYHCVQLLMLGHSGQRPDALLITDDNLVPHATTALGAARVRVPEELLVVAHANFPWPTPSAVPAKRVGFDARAAVQTCMALIDRQRRGRKAAPLTVLEAIVEGEAPASSSNIAPELGKRKASKSFEATR